MSVVTARYTFSGSGEDFGPRKGRRLVVLHTFENSDPTKNTMRDAIAGATWQDRHDVLGSYNRIIAVDGVLGCVPDDRISGGMLAGGAAGYTPRAWLYDMLPANVVNDGNSYALQLCAMGQRAHYDTHGWPQEIIDGFAWSIIEEERATGIEMVVANHADFQPGPGPQTRTDAGNAIHLVMERIPQLLATPEDDMTIRAIITEDWTTKANAPFYVYDPATKSVVRKFFGPSPFSVTSIAELTLADGTDARLVSFGAGEGLLVPRSSLVPVAGTRVVGLKSADCSAVEGRLATAEQTIATLKTTLGTANAKITAAKAALG